MKTRYQKPETKVVSINTNQTFLAGSLPVGEEYQSGGQVLSRKTWYDDEEED